LIVSENNALFIIDKKTKNMNNTENLFLTEKQVANKYQVSTRTLHNLRKAGKLEEGMQYFYLGKQIRYKSIELQLYFETLTLTY
jgi:hypothetical protein